MCKRKSLWVSCATKFWQRRKTPRDEYDAVIGEPSSRSGEARRYRSSAVIVVPGRSEKTRGNRCNAVIRMGSVSCDMEAFVDFCSFCDFGSTSFLFLFPQSFHPERPQPSFPFICPRPSSPGVSQLLAKYESS